MSLPSAESIRFISFQTEENISYEFEVINEYYGWQRLQFTGWLWMPGVHPKEMTLSLGYFTGDIVYNTEE